ncbi:type II secretion system protein N [Chitinimonas lacunae]|uniref:Type II secretion system protein N n=1 Tax=Chitinimonas lacunae TaxID=1963018 RepID=A0ABV8MNT2_9NEIS
MIVRLPDSPWFYRAVNLGLLGCLAWQASSLGWLLLAPRPLPPLAAPPEPGSVAAPTDLGPLTRLFSATAGGPEQPSTLNLKLKGVIAARGDWPAVAVLIGGSGKENAFKAGDEVESGARLAEVNGDHVIIDNRGRRERVELDSKPAPSLNSMMPPPPPSLALTPGMAPPAPLPLPGDERSLNRRSLAGGLQGLNISDWARGIAPAPAGGILIENVGAQPLAPMLGLQNGDVLKMVNGAPLAKTSDISSVYSAFSRDSQINLTVLRHGAPLTLRYRIVP